MVLIDISVADIVSPEGLAVDWISRRLYWTDSSKDIIEVASLDDPRQRAVLVSKGLVDPRGIAVDPHAKFVFGKAIRIQYFLIN